MTINWRQRAAVFRLLVAIYAELGEEGFRGRYGSIANFYGSGATYDAIKTFFAKEIVKAAEEVRAQQPQQRRSGLIGHRRRAASNLHRVRHLDFDEQDLSIVVEREVEARVSHQHQQRPRKRQRVITLSEPSFEAERAIANASRIRVASIEPRRQRNFHSSFIGSRSSTLRQDEVAHSINVQPPPPPAAAAAASTMDRQKGRDVPSVPTEAAARSTHQMRRGHSMTVRTDDGFEDGADQLVSCSYGYVTNQGQFRCALCLCQLEDQEALERHESVSKLHLDNLTKPFVVAKGRAKLAQVTSAEQSYIENHGSELMSNINDTADHDSVSNANDIYQTPLQEQHGDLRASSIQSDYVPIDPVLLKTRPSLPYCEKGKGRAASWQPMDLLASSRLQASCRDVESETQSEICSSPPILRTMHENSAPPPGILPAKSAASGYTMEVSAVQAVDPSNEPGNVARENSLHLPRSASSVIRCATLMKMVDRCLERHPEWIEHMEDCVRQGLSGTRVDTPVPLMTAPDQVAGNTPSRNMRTLAAKARRGWENRKPDSLEVIYID